MLDQERFELCLVVDDDPDVLLSAEYALDNLFAHVKTVQSPQAAMQFMERGSPDVVLLDGNFARGATDGAEGIHWLSRMLGKDPDAAVVIMTAHGGVQAAVEAMKRGATDFISKPWQNQQLVSVVRTAASLRRSRLEAASVAPIDESPPAPSLLLGRSPAMARVASLIAKAAPTDANVLILGENGTGKELVASELHRQSRRAKGPLQSVDLGAIAESLFDAELFGHSKGAFTDAKADRAGRLQSADRGTLFLDEVGNLPLHLQPKLLTALEQRRVTPVGATRPIDIDVRVVSATNLSSAQLRDESRFRQDLLFRLNTVEIQLPPLRDRREDIPMLLTHFLDLYAARYAAQRRKLSDGVLADLVAYDWPGNVRALRHAAERAVILAEGETFSINDFPLEAQTDEEVLLDGPDDLNLDRAERQLIHRALKKHGYNISQAATDLGLTRTSLYRRMEKHGF